MNTYRSAIRAAARRNMLERLLSLKQPLLVTQCHALGHLNKEAEAASECVSAAREFTRSAGFSNPQPREVVRVVADNFAEKHDWPDRALAAEAALVAIDATKAGAIGDAVSAASWAAAAASDKPLVGGDRHDRIAAAALSNAAKAVADGDDNDRILAGAVVLAVALVLRAARRAPTASATEAQAETE